MEGLILLLVFSTMFYGGFRWLNLSEVGTAAPPVELDPNNARDRHEARCIDEQQRFGRERNGYKWTTD